MYSGQIFKDNGYSFSVTNLLSLISNIVLFIAAFISGFFVNSLGRRSMLIYGAALSCLFQIGLAILSKIDDSSLSFISVGLIFLYYLAFNFSLGPIIWLYNSEILPSKGISIATMCNWISATIIVFALPYFKDLWVLFLFYGIICFLAVIFSIVVVKETKGLSKVEIAHLFLPSDSDEFQNLSNSSSQKKYTD